LEVWLTAFIWLQQRNSKFLQYYITPHAQTWLKRIIRGLQLLTCVLVLLHVARFIMSSSTKFWSHDKFYMYNLHIYIYIHTHTYIRVIYCKIKLVHIRITKYLWIMLLELSEQTLTAIIGSVIGFRVKLAGNVPGLGAAVADCVLCRCLWRGASTSLMLPTLVALKTCASTVRYCLFH
jgi:hypothetical protein